VSLIEEALRKQREETEQGESAGAPLDTAPPPPLPEENQEPSETVEQRRTWPLLAGIVGVSAIVLAGLVWLLFFGMKILRTETESGSRPVATAPALPPASNAQPETATAGTQPEVAVVAPTQAGAETNAPAGAETTAPLAAPQGPVTGTSTPPVAAMAPGTNADASASTPAPADTVAPRIVTPDTVTSSTTTPPPAKVEAVMWPRLTVSGIIGTSRGSRGAAIINGQMLAIGASVEGVRVIAVDKQGVELSFGGETRTLTVGGTTD
jgi:hypothetical protein